MIQHIRPAIVVTVFFTLLLGVAYPLAVTGIAALAFPTQAGGSLVRSGGKVVGSALIGQTFAAPGYLHGRPSAAGNGYDASNSSGSNLGPLNPDLLKRVKDGAAQVRQETGQATVPADAVTTSASGLDPHVSPDYAQLQVDRIAKARGVPADQVRKIVMDETEGPSLGFIGRRRVNVLAVNRALDAFAARAHSAAP